MKGATIKLFLAKGSPKGLRTAEISNWSGKAIACPRSDIKELLIRDEMQNPGIYILTGIDSETGESNVYVGEAESLGKRLRSHLDKDFWINVYIFTSKDENLTKAHIKFLEGELIQRISNIKKAKLTNASSSGAKLPESDKADMEVFLDKVYQLLPILGSDLFTEITRSIVKDSDLLHCTIKGLTAKGKRSENGFIVFKDSQAVLKHRESAKLSKIKREELIRSGDLKLDGDYYIFTRDIEFGSPSAAGSVVRGGSTNGLTAWKNKDGKRLKDIEAST